MSKIRKRLSKNEAEFLGIDVKDNEQGSEQARYYITIEQVQEINRLRTTPKKRKFVETIKKLYKNGAVVSYVEKLQSEPIDVPENFEVIKVSTSNTTGQQWVQYAPRKEKNKEDLKLQ